MEIRQHEILKLIFEKKSLKGGDLKNILDLSQATLNRDLKILVDLGWIKKIGGGRSTYYKVSKKYKYFWNIDFKNYYQTPFDERIIEETFNFELFSDLKNLKLFDDTEILELEIIQKKYLEKIKTITPTLLKKEWERFTIELSWKSSEIEGNTYDLLETEALLKYKQKASGKTEAETFMLLNHKEALNYMFEYKSDFKKIDVRLIENLHRILVQNLEVGFNIRNRSVGITGTKYKPLDNSFQIREALENLCEVVNSKKNILSKALLLVLGIAYLQPFEDGNKRTSRLLANALLMSGGFCPLSYRSINPVDYKKALLVFYEKNNVTPFKKLFMDQYKFAVENYF